MIVKNNSWIILYLFFIQLCFRGYSQTYVHIVTDRDDIYKLARIYDITPKQIAKVNGLDSINQKLLLYQKLIIPDKYYQVNKQSKKMVKTIKHKVGINESLYAISRNYGVTVYDLLLLNPNLERGKPLILGEEIKVQVTINNKSQYSQQIIYLNGDLFKYDEVILKDSSKFEAVKRLNANINERIIEINDEGSNADHIFDSFYFPSHDTTVTSRLIYKLILNGIDTTVNKQIWLDSLYEEIFYVKSDLNPKKIEGDRHFLVQSFLVLQELNLANPSNDFLLGLRAVLYYWLGNYQKAQIFGDEALGINEANESALIVRAAIGLEDNHLEYANKLFKDIHDKRPERNFSKFNLATIQYLNNNFVSAIELYSQLLSKSPKLSPEINYRIGHCYILLNDDDNGCEYLRESEKQNFSKGAALRTRKCK